MRIVLRVMLDRRVAALRHSRCISALLGMSCGKILPDPSLQIFCFLPCNAFDRFLPASPILDRRVETCVVCHDHKSAVFILTDPVAEFRYKLEIQCVRSFIALDEGHGPVGLLEPDQTFVTHVRTVPGIEDDQLGFLSRQFQQGDPEIPDVFAVD